jgi:acyl-CoA thioester hydrolase
MLRFDLPERMKLVHTMVIPIRWGDMDAMGHVNNTLYFRYFETIRIEWMHGINAAPNPEGLGPVIVNAFANFHKQLEFPGNVIAKHYVANPGRTSFDTYFTLEREDQPGVITTSGGAKMVWVDFKAQKSVPLPERLRVIVSDGSARS